MEAVVRKAATGPVVYKSKRCDKRVLLAVRLAGLSGDGVVPLAGGKRQQHSGGGEDGNKVCLGSMVG